MPLPEMIDQGISFSLGTDGAASIAGSYGKKCVMGPLFIKVFAMTYNNKSETNFDHSN